MHWFCRARQSVQLPQIPLGGARPVRAPTRLLELPPSLPTGESNHPVNPMISRRILAALTSLLLCALPPLARAADATGILTGSVSNTATGNLLEGARIEIPALSLTALTDLSGRYVLSGVPAG